MESIGQETLDRVTGAVQRVAGAVTGQRALQREGQLHSERADAARDARIEAEHAEVAEELAEAGQEQREASRQRAEVLEEKQRQQQAAAVAREEDSEKALIDEQTKQGKAAAREDAQRAGERARHLKSAASRTRADAAQGASQRKKRASKEQSMAGALDMHIPADAPMLERAIGRGLKITRWPLTAAERVTGRQGSNWVPAVGYRYLESTVMQVAGGLLRNEDLMRRGKAKQASARGLERSADWEAEAARVEAEGQAQAQEQAEQARKTEQEARQSAQKRAQNLEQRKQEREQKVEEKAEAKQETVAERAEKAKEGQRNRARTDDLADATSKQEAATRRGAAARKEKNVVDLDREIANTARTRKSS